MAYFRDVLLGRVIEQKGVKFVYTGDALYNPPWWIHSIRNLIDENDSLFIKFNKTFNVAVGHRLILPKQALALDTFQSIMTMFYYAIGKTVTVDKATESYKT